MTVLTVLLVLLPDYLKLTLTVVPYVYVWCKKKCDMLLWLQMLGTENS